MNESSNMLLLRLLNYQDERKICAVKRDKERQIETALKIYFNLSEIPDEGETSQANIRNALATLKSFYRTKEKDEGAFLPVDGIQSPQRSDHNNLASKEQFNRLFDQVQTELEETACNQDLQVNDLDNEQKPTILATSRVVRPNNENNMADLKGELSKCEQEREALEDELSIEKKQFEEIENKYLQLKKQNEQVNADNKNIFEELQNTKLSTGEESNQQELIIENLNNELAICKQELENCQSTSQVEIEALKQELTVLQEQKQKAECDYASISAKIEYAEKHSEDAEEELIQLENKYSEVLEAQLESEAAKVLATNELQSKIGLLNDQKQIFKEQCDQERQISMQAEKEFEEKCLEEISAKEDVCKELKMQISSLEKELSDKSFELNDRNSKLEEEAIYLTENQEKLEKLNLKSAEDDEKIAELSDKVQEEQEAISKSEAALLEVQKELDDTKIELQTLEEGKVETSNQIALLISQISELNVKADAQSKEMSKLLKEREDLEQELLSESDLEAQKAQEIQSVKLKIEQLKALNEEQKQYYEQLLKKSENKLLAVTDELKELKLTTENEEEQYERQENQMLSEIQGLEHELEEKEQQMQVILNDCNDLVEKNQLKETEIDYLKRSNEESQLEKSELQEEVDKQKIEKKKVELEISSEMRAKIDKLQREKEYYSQLEPKLERAETRATELQHELDDKNSQILLENEELRQENEFIRQEIDKMRDDNREFIEEIGQYKSALIQELEEIQRLLDLCREVNANIDVSEYAKFEAKVEEYKESNDFIFEAETQQISLRLQLKAETDKIKELEVQILEYEEESTICNSVCAMEASELPLELSRLLALNQDLQLKINKIESNISGFDSNVERIKQKYEEGIQEVVEIRHKYENIIEDNYEKCEELNSMEKQVSNYEESLETIEQENKSEIEELNKQILDEQNLISELSGQNNEQENEITSLSSDLNAAKKNALTLNKKNHELQIEKDTVFEKFEEAEEVNATLKTEIKTLNLEMFKKEEETDQIKSVVSLLPGQEKNEFELLMSGMKQSQNGMDNAEMLELQRQNQILMQELSNIEESNLEENIQENSSALETEISELKDDNSSLEERVIDLEEQLQNVPKEKAQKPTRQSAQEIPELSIVESGEVEISLLNSENNTLQQENKQLKKHVDESEVKMDELMVQIKEMKAQLEIKTIESKSYYEQIESLMDEIKQKEIELELEKESNQAEKNMDSILDGINGAEENPNIMIEEIEQLQKKLTEKETLLASNDLARENDKLKKRISDLEENGDEALLARIVELEDILEVNGKFGNINDKLKNEKEIVDLKMEIRNLKQKQYPDIDILMTNVENAHTLLNNYSDFNEDLSIRINEMIEKEAETTEKSLKMTVDKRIVGEIREMEASNILICQKFGENIDDTMLQEMMRIYTEYFGKVEDILSTITFESQAVDIIVSLKQVQKDLKTALIE